MSISKISQHYFSNPIKCIAHKIKPHFHGHRLTPISVLVAGVCLYTLAIYILKSSSKTSEKKPDDNDNQSAGQHSQSEQPKGQPIPIPGKKVEVPVPSLPQAVQDKPATNPQPSQVQDVATAILQAQNRPIPQIQNRSSHIKLVVTNYNIDKFNLITDQLKIHNPFNSHDKSYTLLQNGHSYQVSVKYSEIEISGGKQVMKISAGLSEDGRFCIKMTHPHICPALLDQLQTELQQLGLCKLDPPSLLRSNKFYFDRYVSINKYARYMVEDDNIYKVKFTNEGCTIGLLQTENSPLVKLNYFGSDYRVTSIEFKGDQSSPLHDFYLRLLEHCKAVEGYRQPELTEDNKRLYLEVIRNSLIQPYQFTYLDTKYTASLRNENLLIENGYNFKKLWSNDPAESPWVGDDLNIEWLVARIYDHLSLLQKYNEISKTILSRLHYRLRNTKEAVSFPAFNKQFTAWFSKKTLFFSWTSAGYKQTIAIDTTKNSWLEFWLQKCEEGLTVDNMLDLPFILEKHLNENNLAILDFDIHKHSYRTHDENKQCNTRYLVHELKSTSEEYPLLFADEDKKLYKGWFNQSLNHFYIRSEEDLNLCLTLVLDDHFVILQADLSQSSDAFVKRGLFQQHYLLRLELDHNIPLNNREIERYYNYISPYLKTGRDNACLIPCSHLNNALLAWMDEKTLCVQTATQYDEDQEEYWFRLTPLNNNFTWFTDCNPALDYENRRLLTLADAINDSLDLNYLSDAPSAPLIEQKDVLVSKDETIECYNTFMGKLGLFTGTTPYCFNHEGQCLAAWYNQTAGMINIQKLEDFHKNNNNNKLGIRGIDNNIDSLRVNGLRTQQVRHMNDHALWLQTLRECVNAGTPSLDPQQPTTFQFKPANWQMLHAQARNGIDIENIDIDDSCRKYHVWVGKDQNRPVIYIQPKDELISDNTLVANGSIPTQKGRIAICLDETFKIHGISIEGKSNENIIPSGWMWKIRSLFRSTMIMGGDYRVDEGSEWHYQNSNTLNINVLRDSIVFYPDYHLSQLNQLWENRRLSVKFKSLDGVLESSIDAGGPTKGYLNLLYSSLCHYSALGFHTIKPSILIPQTAEKLHESVLGKLAMLNREESDLCRQLGKFLQNCFHHGKLAGHQLARGVFRALVAIKTSQVADEQERILMVAEALLQGHQDAGMNVAFLIEKITQYRQIKNAGDDWWNTNCLEKGIAVPFKTVLEQIAATDFFPMTLLTDDFTLDWDKATKDKPLVLDAMLDFIFRIYGDHGQLGRQILPLLEMAEGMDISIHNYIQFYTNVQGSLNSPKLIAEAITAHQSSRSARIQERIDWLKSAILKQWDAEQIQKFVLWITDASNLPANGKITIRESQQIFAHTCFSLLDLPILQDQSQVDFIKMIECEMAMSSYSAG